MMQSHTTSDIITIPGFPLAFQLANGKLGMSACGDKADVIMNLYWDTHPLYFSTFYTRTPNSSRMYSSENAGVGGAWERG